MNRSYRWPVDLQLFAQEKTEKATPKKRQESRNKGQVAKSSELPSAFILLFSFLGFFMVGGFFRERLMDAFGNTFSHQLNKQITMSSVMPLFADIILQGLILLSPLFILAMLIAFIVNYMQVGFLLTGDPLKVRFSKLSMIKGFKQMFSLRSLVEFSKTILKLTIIGSVVAFTLWNERDQFLILSYMPIEQVFTFAATLVLGLGIKIGALLVVLAVFDYFYQRYDFEKSIKMSKQDIKDEHKKMEGSPLTKRRIRDQQVKMALKRMMQDVPKADVVITNPTHFAIALKYDPSQMEAPVILAKGMDYVALKIKEVAKENGIITMENKPLARALYERTEIGDTVPADLFQAVAEVLAYVYKLKRRVT